jgi:hypothetical protein
MTSRLVARRAALVGLLAAVSSGAGVSLAQPAPIIEIVQYTAVDYQLAGVDYISVRGTLVNRGPGLAGRISILMVVSNADDERRGGAAPILRVLQEGETSPFWIATRRCCEEGRRIVLSATAQPWEVDRYRGLRVDGLIERVQSDRNIVYGDLTNAGDGFPYIGDASLNVIFYAGEIIVDSTAPATAIPIGGNQSLAPGMRLPFYFFPSAMPYDRYEVFVDANPLATDYYPLPLGLVAESIEVGSAVALSAVVMNCGIRPAYGAVVVVDGRDADGLLLGYRWALAEANPPVGAGRTANLRASWTTSGTLADASHVAAHVHALDLQQFPPGRIPCTMLRGPLYLPWVESPAFNAN